MVEKVLTIRENSALATIGEFESLGRIGGAYEQVDGDCYGEGGLEIINNWSLLAMDAFGPLEQVEGDVCVLYNYQLPEPAFENLEEVGMSTVVVGQDSLVTLDLPVLSSIGSRLDVGGGEGGGTLEALSLPSLVEVGGELSYSGTGTDLQEISFPNLAEADSVYVSINGVANVLAKQAAHEVGSHEALFVRDGHAIEGSHTNLFVVRRDGVLVTYPVCRHILEGVTRNCVLGLARGMGLPVEEVAMPLAGLVEAAEVFVTGTTTEVLPVTTVDGRPIGDGRPGPLTRRLRDAYLRRVDELAPL